MNGWDVATWLSSVALAVTAVWIFVFFLRDARSILNREMHGQHEDDDNASASGPAAGSPPPTPPQDLSR